MKHKAILEIEQKLKQVQLQLSQALKQQYNDVEPIHLTYHGSRVIPYLEGKVAAYENVLDILKEE